MLCKSKRFQAPRFVNLDRVAYSTGFINLNVMAAEDSMQMREVLYYTVLYC